MKRVKYVYAKSTNEYWEITKNQKCKLLKSFWRNSEGHYKLEDENGKIFESPDIFWNDEMAIEV
jgi:hypothetical protein